MRELGGEGGARVPGRGGRWGWVGRGEEVRVAELVEEGGAGRTEEVCHGFAVQAKFSEELLGLGDHADGAGHRGALGGGGGGGGRDGVEI